LISSSFNSEGTTEELIAYLDQQEEFGQDTPSLNPESSGEEDGPEAQEGTTNIMTTIKIGDMEYPILGPRGSIQDRRTSPLCQG
jgi:hypothetical protein